MKKKLLGALLSVAMLSSLLVGCGDGSANTDGSGASNTETKTESSAAPAGDDSQTDGSSAAYAGELEIMHFSTSEESQGNGGSDGFRTVLAQWDEAHPDITLTQNILANAEYKTQIATLAAADDLPDVRV